jgi:Na+/glutamate symporter
MTDNTMAKRKRTTWQTTQWPREKEQNDRQHNGQKKKNKMTDNTIILSFFFWPLCCLSFCSFSFGHCVVCHFVLFLLAIVLSVILLNKIQSWYHHILYLKSTNCRMMKLFIFLISTIVSILYALLLQKQ